MTPELLPLLTAGALGLGLTFLGLIVADWLGATGADVAGAMEAEGAGGKGRTIRALGHVFEPVAAPFAGIAAALEIGRAHV